MAIHLQNKILKIQSHWLATPQTRIVNTLFQKKVGHCGHATYSFSEKGNFSLNFFPRSFFSNYSFVLLLREDSESLHRKASLLRTSKLSDQNDICMCTTEWYNENIRKAHDHIGLAFQKRYFMTLLKWDSVTDIFLELLTAWKMSKYGVLSGLYFPAFGLDMEKTPYLNTFHSD